MTLLSTKPGGRCAPPVAAGQKARWVIGLLIAFLISWTSQVSAQTPPASLTITGACLNSTYTLAKVEDNFESTGRPAYLGSGDVTINNTLYSGTTLSLYYVSDASTWVLAFDGQPYQSNASTASLPPATGWQAVQGEGTQGTCQGSAPFRVVYETTVTSITRAGSPTNAASVNYTVTFADEVSGLSASNFTLVTSGSLSGATLSSVSGSGKTYNVSVNTGSGSGSLQLVLANAQNLSPSVSNLPFPGATYVIDRTPPAISSVAVPANGTYRAGQNLDFTVNFSENVTVTGTPQLGLTIGTTIRQASYVSGNGSTALTFRYSVQAGDEDTDGIALASALSGGTIRDAVGNDATRTLINVPVTTGILVDAVAPTVVSSVRQSPADATTNATALTFRVVFSEPVSGVTLSSFLVTTSGVTGNIASVVSSNATTYDVTVSGVAGNGTIRLDVKSSDSGITDPAGNPLSGGFTGGQTYTIDQTRPSVVISTSPAISGGFLSGAYPVAVTVSFSENVTGFVAGDLSITNGQVSNFTGSGSTYTFDLLPTAKGQTSISVLANVAQDAANNGNSAASPLSFFYLPPVTITGLAATPAAACASTPVTLTATLGALTDTYSFTLTGGGQTLTGSTPNAFSQTLTAIGSGTVNFSLRVFNGYTYADASTSVTVSPQPTVSLGSNGPITCTQPTVTLRATADAQGQALTYRFGPDASQVGGSSGNTATVSRAGEYSVTVTSAGGCTATAQTTVGNSATLATPTLLTQGGQSSVTVDLNAPAVTLLVGGCSGTASWTGSNGSSGTGSTIVVPTSQPGRFVYRATCQLGSCVSDPASATVIVGGRLTVLHRDVDNYVTNNAIQPLIVLQNQGAGSLPLSGLTLRYYLTVEGAAALSNLSISYAQAGNQNVRLRYVPLVPAQAGAAGYVEYSFTEAAGSLAPGASSGPIQAYFAKSDYSGLNEGDDYSYATVRDRLVANLRITAYYNGVLIAGQEPGGVFTPIKVLRALTESKNGPSATQINTFLEIRNEGNVAVNYSDLSARYYFTSDGAERLQVDIDEGRVSAQLVALNPAVGGANYYLELRFTQTGQLAPGASTGRIRYRISKPNGGRFNQTNDYSYQEQPAESSSNNRVTVYDAGERVWGNEPTGSARLASAEPTPELEVTLLGNPVRGDVVSVQIKGGGPEPLRLQLVSAQGRVITQRQVASPQAVEQHELSIAGQGPGVLLLQVSTPTQSRTIRVLKAE
ncbi:cellulose binding domain-containing protein [Fibrella aquatica]|uniref:cellulose binding domain-containing protein n=1 Tax=Fibrella aquatica TaxID=3242487 RepID=UPI0035213F61